MGNGRGLTVPQEALLMWLGDGWVSEFTVPTLKPRNGTYPTAFKIDIANPSEMIAVEVDGASHSGKRLEEDRRKDALLVELGWSVYRVKNASALKLSTISKSQGTLLTSLAEFSYIIAT